LPILCLSIGCSGSKDSEVAVDAPPAESVTAAFSHASAPPSAQSPSENEPAPAVINSASVANPAATAIAAGWQRLTSGLGSAEVFETVETDPSSGAITIMPRSNAWYQSYRGGLLFREVDGDFLFRATVSVAGRDDRTLPQSPFSLAGLLIRSPDNAAGSENFVLHTLGITDALNRVQFQQMVTQNGQSRIEREDSPVRQADLLIARMGASLWLRARTAGGQWTTLLQIQQPDLPSRVQVGLMAATDWASCEAAGATVHNSSGVPGGNPDLSAKFESVEIRSLSESVRQQLAAGGDISSAVLDSVLSSMTAESSTSIASIPQTTVPPKRTPNGTNPFVPGSQTRQRQFRHDRPPACHGPFRKWRARRTVFTGRDYGSHST